MDNGGESEDGGGQLLRPAEREKFSAAGLANQRPPFSALEPFLPWPARFSFLPLDSAVFLDLHLCFAFRGCLFVAS